MWITVKLPHDILSALDVLNVGLSDSVLVPGSLQVSGRIEGCLSLSICVERFSKDGTTRAGYSDIE